MESTTPILLKHIWPIKNVGDYKVHFARRNEKKLEPLDDWAHDRKKWVRWQQYWPGRDDFNRRYIFSLMNFYHETDTWLFGGVFKVRGLVETPCDYSTPDNHQHSDKIYMVERTKQGTAFIGRLKLSSSYRERATRVKFENHYCELRVAEILREPYTGQP